MTSFMEIGLHVFPKSGTQTHRRTDRRGSFIYIDVSKFHEIFCIICQYSHYSQSDDLYQLIPFKASWCHWSCLDLIMETPLQLAGPLRQDYYLK